MEDDLVVYSDGSQVKVNQSLRTGWGFAPWHCGEVVYRRNGAMTRTEVFDAEVKAAREAARWVTNPTSAFPPLHQSSLPPRQHRGQPWPQTSPIAQLRSTFSASS